LKRESRILGISASKAIEKQIPVIGVVFRGNQWLDGIITCRLLSRNPNNVSILAHAITECKQYSQLHAIILAREWLSVGTRVDLSSLSDRINLPVIAIVSYERARAVRRAQTRKRSRSAVTNYYRVKVRGNSLSVLATRLSLAETSEILSLACVKGSMIPEPVRVAELIASRVANLHTLQTAK
jgi:endonuclease V-like protein UPF0215 family